MLSLTALLIYLSVCLRQDKAEQINSAGSNQELLLIGLILSDLETLLILPRDAALIPPSLNKPCFLGTLLRIAAWDSLSEASL